MKKNIIFVTVTIGLFFSFINEGKTLTFGGCEYSKIARLKSLVSNMNLSYDYYLDNNEAYFNITVSNMAPDIYFVDSQTGIIYTYANSVDGEIVINGYKNSAGNYKFYSAISECYGIKLGSKYYNFPVYNYYYDTPICKENRNFSLCQRWVKVTYSYSELKKVVNEFNKKKEMLEETKQPNIEYKQTYLDLIIKIYIKYYYFILLGIIFICVVIMYISNKKNRFDF